MAYQEVNKTQVKNAAQAGAGDSEILSSYPSGTLEQEQAEALMRELIQKAYDEACKVIDPDKEYPPLRF